MKFISSYLVREAIAVLLPMLLTVCPATAQKTIYEGDSTVLEVKQVQGHNYTWELYNDASVDFAVVSGNCPVTSAKFIGSNSGPSVSVKWIQPGIYFYRVIAQDANRCAMNLKVGILKVKPTDIVAIISGPSTAGACQQITLDASGSKGDIVKYEWASIDKGGLLSHMNTSSTDFMISSSFDGKLPSQFRVVLMVTGKNGKTDSDTITIKVDPLPVADIYSVGRPEKDGSIAVDGSISKGVALLYSWHNTDGKIIGSVDKPGVYLRGAGDYTLRVTDSYGCQSEKTYRFPIEQYKIIANPDYARTSWAEDTIIHITSNDISTAPVDPSSVRIIRQPVHGQTKINPDGSVTYMPGEKVAGRDQFAYEVCDLVNLCDSATVTVDVYDAKVALTEGFSPNGDGINDQLVFRGLEKYPESHLYIFTREGSLVYKNNNYQNDWDGRTIQSTSGNIIKVPTGVYYYILELGGTNRKIKGFIYVGY